MLFARAKEKLAIRPKEEPKLPYFWYRALFVIFAVFACCAIQIPLFRFTPIFQYLYRPEVFYTLVAAAFFTGGAYLFMGIKIFHVKIDYVFLAIFGIYCIGNIIAVCCHKNFYAFTGEKGSINIPDYQYQIAGQAFVSGLLSSFALFLFFNFFPAGQKNKFSGTWILEILVCLGLSMAFYSLIAEWSQYRLALNEGIFKAEIVSFTGSKNVYGNYLLLALFAEVVLLERFGHPWRYLMMAFFAAMILFSGSKASLMMAAFVIAATMVYRLFRCKKEGTLTWKRALIPLCIVGVGVLAFIIIAIAKPNFFASFWNALVSFFQNGDGSNVGTRASIWRDSIALNNQGAVYWIFGQGDVIYPYLMSVAMDQPSYGTAHNAILELIGRGGIIRLLAFVGLLGYLTYRFSKSAKTQWKNHVIYLILALPLLLRGLIESVSLFDLAIDSLGYAFIVIMPWLSGNHLKEEPTRASYPEKGRFPALELCNFIVLLVLNAAMMLTYSFLGFIITASVGLLYLIGVIVFCLVRHIPFKDFGADFCFIAFGFAFMAISSAALGYSGFLKILIILGSYFIGLVAELVFLTAFQHEKLSKNWIESFYEDSLAYCEELR